MSFLLTKPGKIPTKEEKGTSAPEVSVLVSFIGVYISYTISDRTLPCLDGRTLGFLSEYHDEKFDNFLFYMSSF